MFRSLAIGCASLALLLGAASADLIDDFSDPTSDGVTLSTSPDIDVTQQTGLDPDTVLGGEREIRLLLESGDQTLWEIPAAVDIWRFDNNASTTATAALNYGKNPEWDLDDDGTFNEVADDGGPDPTASGLDHDFHDDTAFLVTYTSDQDVDVEVQLTSHLGEVTEHTESQTLPFTAHTTLPRANAYAPFSLWSSSLDFSDVDSITFYLRSADALDVTIGEISTIPEPATLSLLGLGALALARWRRRRT